ncbi:dihydropteroate synthase [Gordoniibacillus kamchatkensis]|uniref:Dihydropteroate synthase n=1 Tax=Gordoniibacillus kamchatkensis TaxID=1590651 RepID=A0ABR5AEF1_9BACL|nr:dihydropteroate synthase [Paenibacillus sp. VKM B-2647]
MPLASGAALELGARTLIMGILNVTPDSFSDGGRYTDVDAAVAGARRMATEGADILDIGGESTRPGHAKVSAEEELRRVLPAIRAVRRELPHMPISIDTYKAEVAREALAAGADIINDVWRLTADSGMARVAAEHNCPVILMHNREQAVYAGDIIEEMARDLQTSVELALQAGVDPGRIVLDPGIGFAKTYEHNLEVMQRLGELIDLLPGYPMLLATSRKSFIRRALDLPADDVVEGTAATVALGISQGCEIVRVHDVKPMRRIADMTDAIVRRGAVLPEQLVF